jgi:PAS domain S-box-containing protein
MSDLEKHPNIITLEENLKECEDNFRLLTENMIDIMWRVDTEYRFIYVSPADKKVRGFDASEVLGKTIFDVMTPDSVNSVKEKMMERGSLIYLGAKLASTTFEAEIYKKDGTTYWTEILSNPIYDSQGILIGFQGITRDISFRKKIEQQVREKDILYKAAVSNAPIVLFQIDSNGIFQLSEGMGLAKLGLKPGQVVGLSAYDVYKDFPDICKQVRDALSGKTVKEIIDVNGIIFEIIYNPIVNKKEKIEYLIGIALDITESFKAQEALRISENKFRSLFESMAEGVALHDLVFNENNQPVNYRILEVNPAYEKHTGINNEHSQGKLATEVYGTDTPPYLNEFSSVAMTGKPFHYETYFPPLERYFKISVISPAKNKFATVFEDITGQKIRERELKEKNAELERFTYTVSHDLKSPLVTIKGFIGMLEQDIKDNNSENIRDDLNRIKSAADKMGNLLNDLLELSRIGRIINPPMKVQMLDIIKETIEILSGIIDQSNTKIIIPESMPVVKVDRKRFSEVWQNLIENAIKFMADQPEKIIEIGCIYEKQEHIFYIRDNGIGIEEKYHDNIFGLFNKLDNKTEGTGIGLALVKRIIEVHSGTIWVESEGHGKGTTFKFALPTFKS